MNPKTTERLTSADGKTADWQDVVRRKVEALRFGSVQIIVHDGRVTQVESLEKTRFSTSREDGHLPG